MKRALLALTLLAGACGRPVPPLPPADGPGDCATARANVEQLGGCEMVMETFEQDCRDESAAEVPLGVRFPVGCLTAAHSCQEAWSCR